MSQKWSHWIPEPKLKTTRFGNLFVRGGMVRFRPLVGDYDDPWAWMNGIRKEWRQEMTKAQITASAKRIVDDIVECFNDKPNGKPSPQVIAARKLFGPLERGRAVKNILMLIDASSK